MPYYNENHRGTAEWLRELIDRQCIAPGIVDDRSIVEVTPDDIAGYEQCHWFAGIAGWGLALDLAGWGDRPVWTASLPCQPFSKAGAKRAKDDERNLWHVVRDLIEERQPPVLFGEQVATPEGVEWWDVVSSDLERLNYTAGATVLPAVSIGSPHSRPRFYWFATRTDAEASPVEHTVREGRARESQRLLGATDQGDWEGEEFIECLDGQSRRVEPGILPLVDGLSSEVVRRSNQRTEARPLRLRGYGNAIVPQLAAEFVSAFMEVTGA